MAVILLLLVLVVVVGLAVRHRGTSRHDDEDLDDLIGSGMI